MAGPTIDDLIAQAAQSSGSSSSKSSTSDTPMVYLGANPTPDRGPAMHADTAPQAGPSDRGPAMHFDPEPLPYGGPKPYVRDRIQDAESAANLIYGWSAKERKKWEQVLLDAGLIKPGEYNFADLVQLWQGAVEGAAQLYTQGGKRVTPQQYVKNFLGVDGIGGKGSGAGGPTTTTSTQKSVTHFDDLDARGIAMDTYKEFLGRASNPHEEQALQAALNAYAKAHPSIQTSTTHNDGQGNTTTTNKSRGGITSQGVGQLAQDSIQAKPEYASYQAAATYFPLLEQALGATANVGV